MLETQRKAEVIGGKLQLHYLKAIDQEAVDGAQLAAAAACVACCCVLHFRVSDPEPCRGGDAKP